MTKGTITSRPITDANRKIAIEVTKYLSSLSRIWANAEFGAVITRKTTFGSKEDKQNKYLPFCNVHKYCDHFIRIEYGIF
jgi:hypothetical protein